MNHLHVGGYSCSQALCIKGNKEPPSLKVSNEFGRPQIALSIFCGAKEILKWHSLKFPNDNSCPTNLGILKIQPIDTRSDQIHELHQGQPLGRWTVAHLSLGKNLYPKQGSLCGERQEDVCLDTKGFEEWKETFGIESLFSNKYNKYLIQISPEGGVASGLSNEKKSLVIRKWGPWVFHHSFARHVTYQIWQPSPRSPRHAVLRAQWK